ncbi:MAG: N-acetyl-lysine deacetylase [Metallosphaera sp.]
MHLEKESLKQKGRKLLEELLSVYTPSGSEDKALKVFEWIEKEFNLKLNVTKSNSYFLGRGEILLASHIDTVQGFIEPSVSGETISGRGAVDAKGPLTSMILAGWILNDLGCGVEIAALSDEENMSKGAKELLSSSRRFSHIVIGEPTNTTHIAIEYRGLMRLSIKCKGNPEHSSSSHDNVILKRIPSIMKVSQLHSEYSLPTIVPTILRSGSSANVTPEDLYVHFDIRFPYEVSYNDILSKFKEEFDECDIEIGELIHPVKVSPSTPLVRSLMRGLIRQGMKPSLVKKSGTSDMNILASITPSIATYGPGDSRLEHTEFERITLDEIYIATMTYVNSLEELCSKNS